MGEDNNKTEHIRRQKGRSEITASSLFVNTGGNMCVGKNCRGTFTIPHKQKHLEKTIPADSSKIKEMSAG